MTTAKERQHKRRWARNNPEKVRASSQKYIETHKDEINERRRERMLDPEYAAHTREYHAEYWQRVKEGKHRPKSRPLYRGSERVYRQSEAARMIGCSQAVISKWHAQWLPEPYVESRRLYNRDQVDLMALFYSLPRNAHDIRAKAKKFLQASW